MRLYLLIAAGIIARAIHPLTTWHSDLIYIGLLITAAAMDKIESKGRNNK
jgi:hypothetical protein